MALSAAMQAALRGDKLRQRYAELLTDMPMGERPTIAFHRRFLTEEMARWRPIIQAAGPMPTDHEVLRCSPGRDR